MDYFVSAENTAYHHWQLDLLIESFKLHNLQDHLIIALAENDQPIYANFSNNLNKHKRVFKHYNIGRTNNSLHYNRVYSLFLALQEKLVQPPLLVMHPDTILIKEFEPQECDIAFQLSSITPPAEIAEFVNSIKSAKKIEGNFWIPLGDTIYLKNENLELLRRVGEVTGYLAKNKIDNAEKLGWIIGLLEYSGHLQYYGSFDFENTLLDDNLKYLIHYKHGLPPAFNKKMFYYETFGMGDPYEILLQHNPTIVTNYLQQIVNRCYKRKDNGKIDLNVPLVNVVKG